MNCVAGDSSTRRERTLLHTAQAFTLKLSPECWSCQCGSVARAGKSCGHLPVLYNTNTTSRGARIKTPEAEGQDH